jgi:Flp pilus assembly protein TadD
LERVAVIPFENLTASRELDWASEVLPRLLSSGPANQPLLITAVGSERDLIPARSTRVLRGYLTQSGDALHAHATVYEVNGHKAVASCDARAGSTGELATAIAQQCLGVSLALNAPAQAIEAFGHALAVADTDREAAIGWAEKAVAAAPRFAPAVLLRAQLERSSGDGAGTAAILQKAVATGPAADAKSWDAAQIRVAAASLAPDLRARIEAIKQAAALAPYNTDLIRQLSDTLMAARYSEDAAAWLARLTELEPREVSFWNQRAYAEVHARKFDAAKSSAERYRNMAPADPNAEDTSGEIAWMSGRFADAEKHFLEAQRISPQFLGGLEFSKAAFARYLSGDLPGADSLFARYLESRRAAQDPLVPLREAHWLELTGRDKEAAAAYQKIAAGEGELAARAGGLWAVLLVKKGEREQASSVLKQAAAKAKTPFALSAVATVAFLAQPKASPQEWSARADKSFSPQTPVRFRQILLAHALVLDRHAQAAIAVLEPLLAVTPPTEGDELKMMFGWAWATLKEKPRAVRMLQLHPLPPHPAESLLASVYFPSYREWRKAAGLP